MVTPAWRLDWLQARLEQAGARRLPATRKGLRLLHDAYMVAMHGRRRRLRGAIKRAGEHGALAASLGKPNSTT